MPAVGSSSNSTRGSSASASPMSSSFWSPCERLDGDDRRLVGEPEHRHDLGGALAAFGQRETPHDALRLPRCACTAAVRISSTVSDGKMLAIWNARPMPRRTIWVGEQPADVLAGELHAAAVRAASRRRSD